MSKTYKNIKIYNINYCLDENNQFPETCNLPAFYNSPLINSKQYSDITCNYYIGAAFYFVYPFEGNYQHWIVEQLPRFKSYLEYNDLIILVSAKAQPYIKEFIDDFVLDKNNILFINQNDSYFVSNLIVPNFVNFNFQTGLLKNTEIYQMIIDKYTDQNLNIHPKKYIYISRRDNISNPDRNLINEEELENALLNKYNINAVKLVNLTFKEKVQLFMYNHIIGFPGAGMINIIFSNNIVYMIKHPTFKCLYFWNQISRQFNCQLSVLHYYTYLEKSVKITGKRDNLPYFCNIQKLTGYLSVKKIFNQ